MTAFKLGLVADDLTGANDTAVQFARRGWEALLVLERGLTPVQVTPYVLALTTDSRALDNAAAEKRTSDAVAQLIAAGVDRLYLKIDSTMRGSVAGQIAGALRAWRVKHPNAVAVVCPAYPRMGRTVIDNQLLVSGEPVERSPIGRDPITPVTTGDLALLIPRSQRVSSATLAQNPGGILTADARSDADLADLASAIETLGASAIPVGSAGLADAMAEVWGQVHSVRLQPGFAAKKWRAVPSRILIQVTSLNPVSHAQIEKLAEMFPEVVVLSGRAEEVSIAFADRVERQHWDLVGLIGGDGARAALHRLGAVAIRVAGAPVEGIPLGVIVGGRADGVAVFSKAGGFGSEDALVRLIEGLNQ